MSAHFLLTAAQHLATRVESAPKELVLTEQPQGLVCPAMLSRLAQTDLSPQMCYSCQLGCQSTTAQPQLVQQKRKIAQDMACNNQGWPLGKAPATSRRGSPDFFKLVIKRRQGLEASLLLGHSGIVVLGGSLEALLEAVRHCDEAGGLRLVVLKASGLETPRGVSRGETAHN